MSARVVVMDIRELFGLSEKDAIAKIKKSKFIARVVRRDKQSFTGTCDFRTDRINLEIDKGKVTKANIG